MRNAGLDEAWAGIKIVRKNINNLRYTDDTTLMAESEDEPKSLLMKMKEVSENVGLKLNIQKSNNMVLIPSLHGKYMGKQWKQWWTLFWGGSKITAVGDYSHEIKRRLLLGRKVMANLDNILKTGTLLYQQMSIQSNYGFPSSHIWIWELDYKESWVSKNWWFWTVVLEKTLESPLDCKEIQPVHPKGNQSWISIGRTHAEAETPILRPPDMKN